MYNHLSNDGLAELKKREGEAIGVGDAIGKSGNS